MVNADCAMTVCFVTPYSPKEITGVGKVVEDICRGLKKKGIDSVVITKRVKPVLETEQNIIELDCDNVKHFKDVYLGIRTAITIFKLRREIDLLHLQTPLPQSAFSAVIGQILGIPVVTTVHGVFPVPKSILKNFFYSVMSKITFFCSDELIFVSEGSKEYYNILKGRVILNGIDTNHFNQNDTLRDVTRTKLNIKDNFVFLFVGRVTPTKGIEEIIEATSIIKDIVNDDFKVLIVGPVIQKEMPDYQNKIRDADIDNYVINLGVQKNVRNFYYASDVFLLPSHFEGLPLVLLEAMACGLPVIASRVGEIPNIIENYMNGLLVEPRNVDDLVEKMMLCIDNKNELALMGKNAAKTIREEYSLGKMIEKYTRVYNNFINVAKLFIV